MRQLFFVSLFVVSLFAGQFVPYVEDYESATVDSAALAPDGKSMYTHKNGVVTRWQLNPIKPLDSFRTGIARPTAGSMLNPALLVSDDGKNMVIRTRNLLQLWDLKKHKLIGEVAGKNDGAVLIGRSCISIRDDKTIVKRSLDDFSIKLSRKLKYYTVTECPEGLSCLNDYYIRFIVGAGKSFYISAQTVLLEADSETLAITKVLGWPADYVDLKREKLYYMQSGCGYDVAWEKCRAVVDIRTGEDTLIGEPVVCSSQGNYAYFKKCSIKNNRVHTASFAGFDMREINGMTLLRMREALYFLDLIAMRPIASFYQFSDSEWIVMNENYHFQGSVGSRRYLKMVDVDEPVPGKIRWLTHMEHKRLNVHEIDEKTFAKFNKEFKIERPR